MYLILAASPKERYLGISLMPLLRLKCSITLRSYWNFGVPVDPNVAEAAARLFLSHPEQPSYDATGKHRAIGFQQSIAMSGFA